MLSQFFGHFAVVPAYLFLTARSLVVFVEVLELILEVH